MPANRQEGMDHQHYDWSPLPERPILRWPKNAPLALGALVILEHYEWEPPEGSYSLRSPSGGLIKFPTPDYVQLTHREYGHRVGIFRVLDMLDRHGVPATIAVDATTALQYPWLIEHCMQRGCELIGHGIAASQLITSKMGADEEIETIGSSLNILEQQTGLRPRGWLSPEGVESSRTPQIAASAGLSYICDWPNDEQPYKMSTADGDLTALPLFLELDDEFALWTRRASLDSWERMIVTAGSKMHADGQQTGRLLMLTLRPWLTGQPFRIKSLGNALESLAALDPIFMATGSQIVDSFAQNLSAS